MEKVESLPGASGSLALRFLSCSEIREVLGPSCPHVHLQWASRVCLASDCSPSKDGRGPWMQLGSPRGEEVGAHDH